MSDPMSEPIYEWVFAVPSDQVDVERIYRELRDSGESAINQFCYMEQLASKAPVVWGRLREWALANNKMNWVNWDYVPPSRRAGSEARLRAFAEAESESMTCAHREGEEGAK